MAENARILPVSARSKRAEFGKYCSAHCQMKSGPWSYVATATIPSAVDAGSPRLHSRGVTPYVTGAVVLPRSAIGDLQSAVDDRGFAQLGFRNRQRGS
jgi:hypothetical protein